MTAKHLLIGFDGADLHVVEELGAEALPNLFALMERGAFSPLESVKPPATLPNWLTFLTGVDPGEHGVFDFTVREGYGVRFRAGTVREAPLLAERLDTMGQRTAWLSFPGTWPPPALEHGVFISGWDAPVAF
ncbi:MAG: alkaline phosphatase family protein, partial [Myxococcales bacterium]|nr:alkaline phosphatase family protein [Myxococcales bacterium]